MRFSWLPIVRLQPTKACMAYHPGHSRGKSASVGATHTRQGFWQPPFSLLCLADIRSPSAHAEPDVHTGFPGTQVDVQKRHVGPVCVQAAKAPLHRFRMLTPSLQHPTPTRRSPATPAPSSSTTTTRIGSAMAINPRGNPLSETRGVPSVTEIRLSV